MPSDYIETVTQLLNETEANLKLIENYGSGFPAPVLNEWRYVTRHVISGIAGNDDSDAQLKKSISHLKRARFDSYDILLLCQFGRINELRDRYGYFANCVMKYIPDYADCLLKVKMAQRLHKEYVNNPNRDKYYNQLKNVIFELEAFIGRLEATESDWLNDIRKEVFENRLKIVKLIGAFFVGATTILGIIFGIMR